MVKASRCIYCGELGGHDTPRQNKNCVRRHRSISPKLELTVQKVLPQKFDESAVFSAFDKLYPEWKSSLEEE